ncbi:MAG TPA: DUF2304 domain-containing protein [Myxococcaceae bacterium]|nr:DUF2304 domain-containing protein [Myxococcaceae bacterium]
MTAHPLLPRELQLVSAFVLVCFLGWVVHLIRGRRLSLRDSLLWLVSTFGVLLLTLFPDVLRWMASQLRIEVASNALFAAAILYLALNLLSLTIGVSNSLARLRRLTQECTILRTEVKDLRAQLAGAQLERER